MLLLSLLACDGPPGGVLLYVQEDDKVPHTVGLQTPGVTPRRLAKLPGASFPAAPDPRGTDALLIGVDESKGHVESLWLLPLDGSPARDLGVHASALRNPAWAPDGSFVILEADLQSYRDLYRVDRTGALRRLTDSKEGSFEPTIAPDGQSFAFVSSRDGNPELYRAAIDGSGVTRLTNHPGEDTKPAFTATGRLSWIAQRDGHTAVWTMAADGSDAHPLREGATADLDFAWSPDGAAVAVVSRAGPKNLDLTVYDAQGALIHDLSSPATDENPAWGPDNHWIAFTSERDGDAEIYLANLSGAIRRVTTRTGADWLPRWTARPAGKTALDDLKPPPIPGVPAPTP